MSVGVLSRRAVLVGAGASAVTGVAGAQGGVLMKTIPSTGVQVPAVGIGTWRTFDVGANAQLRNQRTQVLRTFFEMGGAIVDSSPMYGSSQSVIGHALKAIGDAPGLFSADKVWTPGGEDGREQIAHTRHRWNVEQFDLLQVHNLVNWRSHLETLFEMKAAGDLAHVGVTSYSGLRYGAIEEIMKDHPLDFIQVTYNLADREAEQRLLPLAREKDIAVIANRPFREGALINHVKRYPLPAIASEIGAGNWAQFLLKFIVSHPALTAAIPATRRVDHMRENMGALTRPMPDRSMRNEMKKAFDAL